MSTKEGAKLHLKTFNKGAKPDYSENVLGATPDIYYDAKNMRPTKDGAVGRIEKIGGELLIYDFADATLQNDTSPDLSTYKCVGAIGSTTHLIGFFASSAVSSGNNFPMITVDDKIMCYSDLLNPVILYNKNLSLAVNDSLSDGIVSVCGKDDSWKPVPMLFDIYDMITEYNTSSGRYFLNFSLSFVTVGMKTYMDFPKFNRLVEMTTGDGLQQGSYSYAIQYGNDSGDLTMWSVSTPLIAVPEQYTPITPANEDNEGLYPHARTWGYTEVSSTAGVHYTKYGIEIKFRVTNLVNYKYIRVKRTSHNIDAPLGTPAITEYYRIPIPLTDGLIETWTFIDRKIVEWLPLTDSGSIQQFAEIACAKNGVFYDKRLALFNVEYFDRDLTCDFLHSATDNKLAIPILKNMGVEGHINPEYRTNYKSRMRGEKYTNYLVAFDDMFNFGFAIEIKDDSLHINLNNYKMPDRRTEIGDESYDYMHKFDLGLEVPIAVDENNVIEKNVYETFSLPFDFDGKGRFVNGKNKIHNTSGNVYNPISNPLRPYNYEDEISNYNENPMNHVSLNGTLYEYMPLIFSPTYYSLGLALMGIENIPSWVSGFKTVRTRPAKRVISQGLISYSLKNFTGLHDGNTLLEAGKNANKAYFYSSDIDKSFEQIPQVGQQLEIVSPLGYVNESYGAFNRSIVSGDNILAQDVILYPRLFYTHPTDTDLTTPLLLQNGAGTDDTYWTKFGQWRNKDARNISKKYTITDVKAINWGGYGRQTGYELTLDPDAGFDDIYSDTTPVNEDTNAADVMDHHEPFYIANIISEYAETDIGNIKTLLDEGTFIKTSSLIGVYKTGILNYELVTERLNDCIPINGNFDMNSYIWVEDKAYLNVSYRDAGQIAAIKADITANGFYVASNSDGFLSPFNPPATTTNCYGVFTTTNIAGIDYVVLDVDTLPSSDSKIFVKYDNRIPIEIFDGDTIIGESLQCTVDGIYQTEETYPNKLKLPGGNAVTFTGLYSAAGLSFPYGQYQMSDQFKYLINTIGIVQYAIRTNAPLYSGTPLERTHQIRQLCIMFTSENRADLCYSSQTLDMTAQAHPTVYPQVNYLLRPLGWDDDNVSANLTNNSGNVEPETAVLFEEYSNKVVPQNPYRSGWAYGGFQVRPSVNSDYSAVKNDRIYTNKPIVGYKSKTVFPTRIVNSNQKSIAIQDMPNLRTFLSNALYDAQDTYGEGKLLFTANSQRGENIFGFTEHGVVLLLAKKTELSESTGNTIGFIPMGINMIQGEIWLQKEIGMNAETWLTSAENNEQLFFTNKKSCYLFDGGNIINLGEFGFMNVLKNKAFPNLNDSVASIYNAKYEEYWINIKKSARVINVDAKVNTFQLTEGKHDVNDIFVSKNEYVNIVSAINPSTFKLPITFDEGDFIIIENTNSPSVLKIQDGTTSVVDLTDGMGAIMFIKSSSGWEYKVVEYSDLNYTIVFSASNILQSKHLDYIGEFSVNTEKFARYQGDSEVYSFKDTKVYKQDIGGKFYNEDTANGDVIESELIFPVSCEQGTMITREWISVAFSCMPKNIRPTKVEFADTLFGIINSPEAELSLTAPSNPNKFYLKDYGNWSQWIPRKSAIPRYRFQHSVIWIKVTHSDSVKFGLNSAIIGEKTVKLL